jgi:hypothetical protein
MAITPQTLYRHVAPDRTLREDALTSFYSALFWTDGVGAAFKRIECSTQIGGKIIVLDMRKSLRPADTKNRKGPRVSTTSVKPSIPKLIARNAGKFQPTFLSGHLNFGEVGLF